MAVVDGVYFGVHFDHLDSSWVGVQKKKVKRVPRVVVQCRARFWPSLPTVAFFSCFSLTDCWCCFLSFSFSFATFFVGPLGVVFLRGAAGRYF